MGYENELTDLKIRARRLTGIADGHHDPIVERAINEAIAAGFTSPRRVAKSAMTLLDQKSAS